MADPVDISDLISGGPSQADALIQALRARQLGGILQISGNKGLMAGGQGLEQGAQEDLNRNMQERHFGLQTAQLENTLRHQRAVEANMADKTDIARQLAGLKAGELMVDGFGNVVPKHRPSLLPGATGAAHPSPAPAPVGPGGPAPAPAAGGIGPFSAAAIDQAAEQYSRTGKMPQLGRGRAAAAMSARIATRAAELHPDADLAGNNAGYIADSGSLKKQQSLLDLTQSWESTGKANLGVLKDVAGSLVNAGSPLVNKPLRWLYQNALGDPNVTKFRAAHAAVVNEYAKILSGNTGGGGVTEGARHEAEAMLPLDSTPTQIAAAASVLESDAGNRLSALKNQLEATKQRTGSKSPAAPPIPAGKATHRFNPATGKIEAIP